MIAGTFARGERGIERRPLQTERGELLAQRVATAADQQRLRLRQRVRDQQRLLFGGRILRAHGYDELHRNVMSALMQPLEKCMLGVGAGAAP